MKIRRNLNFKITSRFLVLFALAFSILIIVISTLFSSKLNSELKVVSGQKLGLIAAELNNSLKEIRTLHFNLIHDDYLQILMHEYNNITEDSDNINEAQRDEVALQIRNRVTQSLSKYSSVRSAFMVSNKIEILSPVYGVEPYSSLLLRSGEYEYFINSQMTGRFSSANGFPINKDNLPYEEKYTITYFGHYYDKNTYEDLGSLAINYAKLSLQTAIEPMFSSSFEYSFVMDENNNFVVCSKNCPETIPDEILNSGASSTIQIEGRSYAVISDTLTDYNNWRIYGVIDYDSIMQPVNKIIVISVLVALAVLILVFITSMRIAGNITTPLKALGKAMSRLGKGKWETLPEPEKPDEIGLLTIGYNSMVGSLEILTERIAKDKDEKKEIEISMLKARLELLQTQINPHFIHNTLNTMNYMAQKDGAQDLSKIITAFNALLRASMSTQNMFYTVQEEVENLRHYIDIQLSRYDIQLECMYDVSDESKFIMIPKLILQPLVENSLFHGIVPKGGGKITIKICNENCRLWVSVIDNGAGIPKDKLKQIIEGSIENNRGYNSIGLANVTDRLVLAYGEASRLVMDSLENQGTTISFSIPIGKDI